MKIIDKIPPLVFLFGLLTACSSALFAADTLPWVSAEPVLFRDSFSLESGGWTVRDEPRSFVGYDRSGFRLWSEIPDYQLCSTPGLNFKDTLIYVRARKIGGNDDNLFGVICRYQDEANYYALVIGSDGYYGILKRVDGEQTLIDQANAGFSEVINRGESINDLQAVCQGDQLALLVNGTRLLQVQDGDLRHGDVGLIVGNFETPGVDILFDDFIVIRP